MLGLNHSVRNTPVSSRTTKLHSAISPSMKDQWSGKTLRSCFLPSAARPRRSSAQVAAAPARFFFGALAGAVPLVLANDGIAKSPTFPEARAYRLGEVAGRDQVALAVHRDGELRKCTGGRAEDDPAVVRQVEGGLVAGAQQVVRLLLPQGDRAPDVGADLGVAQDALDAPVLTAGGGGDVAGLHPDDDRRGLGLGLLQTDALVERLAVLLLEEHARLGVDQLADLDLVRPD